MAEEEQAEQAAEEKKKKPLLLIIIIAVIVLAGGGAGAYFALSSSDSKTESKDGELDDDEDSEIEEEMENDNSLPGAILPLDEFVINLGKKSSFLKVKMQIEFSTPELPETVTSDTPKIRHAIIMELSNQKGEDLLTIDGKENLKEIIIDAINGALGKDEVQNLYYSDFIIQ
jgi:flagellar FliL protein